jgi:lipoprotein-anchoring transpeptidase ErfK/SrfK
MRFFLKRLGRILAVIAVIATVNFSVQYFFPDEYQRFFEPVPNKVEIPAPLEPNEFNVEVTLMRLGIPTGVVDGVWDERTKQGVCAWRELTGREINRTLPTIAEQSEIVKTVKIEPAAQNVVGVNVNKSCQVAIWIKDNSRQNFEVFTISTGDAAYHDTDNGDWRISWRLNGWHESSLFPDGWMYRPMYFSYTGAALHGSEMDSMVHWYPASHGCVRMLHVDIDKLWKAGFGVGDSVRVYGSWKG